MSLQLRPAFPNPFVDETTLTLGIPSEERVAVIIYDLLGRKVETLVDDEKQAGWHEVRWRPKSLVSGVYFVVLESESDRHSLPVVLTR